jgi:hypothetical protein
MMIDHLVEMGGHQINVEFHYPGRRIGIIILESHLTAG